MQQWLIQLVTIHPYLVYGIIIIVAAAEGPILSILLGVLIKLGFFMFIPSYAAVIAGDVISDIGWYYVGMYFGHAFIKRFGKYFSITEGTIEKVTKIFHKYNTPILFASKITNGFGLSLGVLLTAGISGMYLQVYSFFGKASVVGLFIVIIVAFLGFIHYLRKRVEK